MADLTAIRALLASVQGFTPGPWEWGGADQERYMVPGLVTPRGLYIVTAWTATAPVEVKPCVRADAILTASAPTLHAHLTDLVGEVERLRAHNARMAAQINALADACDREESAPWGSFPICDALPPGHWPETATALRALAAGEVDDGR